LTLQGVALEVGHLSIAWEELTLETSYLYSLDSSEFSHVSFGLVTLDNLGASNRSELSVLFLLIIGGNY
jgi:hypothetical protein